MSLQKDVDLQSFVSPEDPTDCTLVLVGGKFLRKLPQVLKKIDGKGFKTRYEVSGPEAAVRKVSKTLNNNHGL